MHRHASFATPLLMALLALGPAGTAAARADAEPPPPPTDERANSERDREIMATTAFANGHPDMRFRADGLYFLRRGQVEDAITRFRRAARYADKPSQAMLGELYWTGQGVEVDRALGYAWMDLAAERGYRSFLVLRERYWSEMTEAERARAVEVGGPLFEQYGDAVAKPRLERVMRRALTRVTGSRTGFQGNLRVVLPGPAGSSIEVRDLYAERYWNPERYYEWQDEVWRAPSRARVTVGELEVAPGGELEAARQAVDDADQPPPAPLPEEEDEGEGAGGEGRTTPGAA